MAKYSLFIAFCILAIFSCKKKKKEPAKNYISALSIIKGQVAHVDTSMYLILRIEYIDSLHNDTFFMKREEFRAAAKDFLDIPDLADEKVASRYKEEKLGDETIGRFVITYTPLDPAKEEIQKQEIVVTPTADGNSNINNIIINRVISNRDSAVQKNMLWQMDKFFQVITIRQLPGQHETTTVIKVSWNEDNDQ